MTYTCPNDATHNQFRKTFAETYHVLYTRQGTRLRRERASIELVALTCTFCGAAATETKGDHRP